MPLKTSALLLLLAASSLLAAGRRTVVVLSMDAFRWDYPLMYNTPTLDSLRKVGISATTIPPFPANTFPSHYAMATGLWPDHHGIVDNKFTDKTSGLPFWLGDRAAVENPYFWKGEPIWNTAERQGLKSFIYSWPGSEAPIGGHYASRWKKYANTPAREKIDSVHAWLSLPESDRPNLIMWYLPEPDHTSHTYGPRSTETQQVVEQLDRDLRYFFDRMRTLREFQHIDFIITSDHGMEEYTPERYINLYHKINPSLIRESISYCPMQLFANGSIDSIVGILDTVQHINVWKRTQMPERFHYGTDDQREGDIIILPEIGYRIDYSPIDRPKKGSQHGYDPNEPAMQTIFFGVGPSFKKGFQLTPKFDNINLHNIIAYLLNIQPAPNDGDLQPIRMIFTSPTKKVQAIDYQRKQSPLKK